MIRFKQTADFAKDLKKIQKKWRSLSDDIERVKLHISLLYIEQTGFDIVKYRRAFFNGKRATILRIGKDYEVIKMRLDVASLNSNSKVRVVFVAIKTVDKIIF